MSEYVPRVSFTLHPITNQREGRRGARALLLEVV